MPTNKSLKRALADQAELFTDTQFISHPYTDQHISELRRRSIRIGAGLSGEDRNKYVAVQEVGMQAVAAVQKRNSQEVVQDSGFVGVAGVQSTSPRWLDRMESLEYALSAFGLSVSRSGDDEVTVRPFHLTPETATVEAVAVVAKSVVKVKLTGSLLRRAKALTEETYIHDALDTDKDLKKLNKDDMLLLMGLVNESNGDGADQLKQTLLDAVGIR